MNVHTFYPGRGRDPYNSATTYRDHVVARVQRDVKRKIFMMRFFAALRVKLKRVLNELYGSIAK